MSPTLTICSALAGISLTVHLASHVLAWTHLRRRAPREADTALPSVSLVRPLCGVEPFTHDTLDASFRLAHPEHELIFCVMDARDPVVPVVNEALARHPSVRASLLVGGVARSGNPKLDNLEKGYRSAKGEVVIFADSNLLVAPDYLTRVLETFDAQAGLVSAPPVGGRPDGFWANVECALLNTYAARWQYAVAALGFGFAQGKTLAFRRTDLEAGAFDAMAHEAAEDAAATKFVRRSGRKVRLVTPPFPQLIGKRTAAAVWSRHLRWARLRRATFPLLFAPEVLSSAWLPGAFAVAAAQAAGLPLLPVALGFALIWYGAEAWLARAAGWPLPWCAPLAFLGRDVLILALWVGAWTGRSFVWRGHAMSAGGLVTPPGSARTHAST